MQTLPRTPWITGFWQPLLTLHHLPQQPALLAHTALLRGIPPHSRPGAKEVWTPWVEYPLRVQQGGLHRKLPVHDEPLG